MEENKVLAHNMYKDGMSIEEIAKTLGKSVNVVKAKYLSKEIKINKRKQGLQMIETVHRMREAGDEIEDIAEKLHISINKTKSYLEYTRRDIEQLKQVIEEAVKRNEKEIESLKNREEQKIAIEETIQNREEQETTSIREEIKKMYNNNSIKEIACDIGVTEKTIREEITEMLILGEMQEQLRNKMQECYKKGIRGTKRLKIELGVKYGSTIEKLKREFREKGEIQKYDEIIDRVKELYYLQKTDEEISETLGIPTCLAIEIVKNLIICKEVKREFINKRVEELYDMEKTDEEISKILHICIEDVAIIKKRLINGKKICTREEIKKIKELYRAGVEKGEIAQTIFNSNYLNKRIDKYIGIAIEEDMANYRKKFEGRQIKIEDLDNIKKTILVADNGYKNSLWFLKVLVTFKQFKTAENFIEEQFFNDKLTKEEQSAILQQKEKLKTIYRNYQANKQLKIMENEQKTEEQQLNNENKNRRHEENDDGDGPSL